MPNPRLMQLSIQFGHLTTSAEVLCLTSGSRISVNSKEQLFSQLYRHNNKSSASLTGKVLAKRLVDSGVKEVFLDQKMVRYHGKMKEFLDSITQGGVKIRSSPYAEEIPHEVKIPLDYFPSTRPDPVKRPPRLFDIEKKKMFDSILAEENRKKEQEELKEKIRKAELRGLIYDPETKTFNPKPEDPNQQSAKDKKEAKKEAKKDAAKDAAAPAKKK